MDPGNPGGNAACRCRTVTADAGPGSSYRSHSCKSVQHKYRSYSVALFINMLFILKKKKSEMEVGEKTTVCEDKELHVFAWPYTLYKILHN